MPALRLEPGAEARVLAVAERPAGVTDGEAVDVHEPGVQFDRDDASDEAHVAVPVLEVDGRQGRSRVTAEIREPDATLVHVQQHASLGPVVPGGRGVR